MDTAEFKKYATDAYVLYLNSVICPQCHKRHTCEHHNVSDFTCDYAHIAFRRLAELHELLARPIILEHDRKGGAECTQ